MNKKYRGLSLMELLMAVAIFSLIVIAMFAISAFSYRCIVSANRRAVLQNACSLIIDHVTKYIGLTIGSNNLGVPTDGIFRYAGPPLRIAARLDGNTNGIPDDGVGSWNGYRFDSAAYTVTYIRGTDSTLSGGTPIGLATGIIRNFDITLFPGQNFVFVTVTAVHNPANPISQDNPGVLMEADVSMPMVNVR